MEAEPTPWRRATSSDGSHQNQLCSGQQLKKSDHNTEKIFWVNIYLTQKSFISPSSVNQEAKGWLVMLCFQTQRRKSLLRWRQPSGEGHCLTDKPRPTVVAMGQEAEDIWNTISIDYNLKKRDTKLLSWQKLFVRANIHQILTCMELFKKYMLDDMQKRFI